jgi:hypothetical protein
MLRMIISPRERRQTWLQKKTACETSRYFDWTSRPNCLKYDHKLRASVSSLMPENNFFVPGILSFGS